VPRQLPFELLGVDIFKDEQLSPFSGRLKPALGTNTDARDWRNAHRY
jgi:hypothetical protein